MESCFSIWLFCLHCCKVHLCFTMYRYLISFYLPAMEETRVRSLGWEFPLEKGVAIHSSILAWRIPWTEKPGGLQSIGLQRVGHDWATNTHTHNIPFYGYTTFCLSICQLIEGNGNPLQRSCLENPMDRGAWWATVHGVAKSRTRLSD